MTIQVCLLVLQKEYRLLKLLFIKIASNNIFAKVVVRIRATLL